MTNDNDDPKDWEEMEEENPPENLRRKWIEREYFGKETVVCPSCQKHVPSECIDCIFCGKQVYFDSGLLGKILKWFKDLFR